MPTLAVEQGVGSIEGVLGRLRDRVCCGACLGRVAGRRGHLSPSVPQGAGEVGVTLHVGEQARPLDPGEDLVDPGDEPVEAGLSVAAGDVEGAPMIDQPAFDGLEAMSAEQRLEHVVAFLGARGEEGLELSLRQHHHLAELVLVHAEHAR